MQAQGGGNVRPRDRKRKNRRVRLLSGVLHVVAQRRQNAERRSEKRIARIGKECDVCGYTQEEFKKTFLFGCPECYTQMRNIAVESALKSQGMTYADLKNPRRDCFGRGMDMQSTLLRKDENIIAIAKKNEFSKAQTNALCLNLSKTTSFPLAYDLPETCADSNFRAIANRLTKET